MKKQVISLVLAIMMVISLLPATFFASDMEGNEMGNDITAEVQGNASDVEVGVTTNTEDISGQVYSDIFGDGSDYQVINIELNEDYSEAEVSYIAAGNCTLLLTVIDETSTEAVFSSETEAAAGTQTVYIELDPEAVPEYFWIEAVLTDEGQELSEVYSYTLETQAYLDFQNTTAEDLSVEEESVVLDFGMGSDGNENIALVSSDVKVVYVDSINDVEMIGSDSASLFGLVDEPTGFVFTDVVNDEILDTLDAGDKLMVLPLNDASAARVMLVDSVEETVSLFGEGDEVTAVEVMASSEEYGLEDFFDFIRINVEAEAGTDAIDTSDADSDIEFLDTPVVDPSAEAEEMADLFGTGSAEGTVSANASITGRITLTKGSAKLTVTDTISLSAKIRLKINYNKLLVVPTKITKITATSTLTAKNVFNVHASASASFTPAPKKIGTIPLGSVAGVSFRVPVYLTFSATFNGEADFTATNTLTQSTTVTYESGSVSSSSTKSASSTKSIESKAKIVVKLGVKACFEISFLEVLTGSLNVEVGARATGTLESINSTSTYKHDAIACLTVDLDLYLTPSFTLKLVKKVLADKSWSTMYQRIFTFYAHLGKNGKWSYGTGGCPHREYRITLKVTDKSGKALQGVNVKENGNSLGTTNSNGELKVWLKVGNHTLKFSKTYYTTATMTLNVTGAVTKTQKMTKSGANEAYHNVTVLNDFNDEEWATFIADEAAVADTIFRIESEQDLAFLSSFAARTDRTTKGLRFVLNNATGVLDMSGIAMQPIGSSEKPFQGELDGNGFTITGLTINTGSGYTGLFGSIDGALIHDLTLSNVSITGSIYTGALAGYATGGSNVYDIGVSGTVSGGNYTGGIFGGMNNANLRNSYSTAAVSGGSYVGGITGSLTFSDTAGLIANCFSLGTINGSTVGGICGELNYEGTALLTADGEEEEEVYEVGIQYVYYLEDTADSAIGKNDLGLDVAAYSVTQAQANGTETEQYISDEAGYAHAFTLVDALNNWYTKNGAFVENEESGEEPEEPGDEIPEGSVNDYYNKWYSDTMTEEGDGGFPIFAEKAKVYALTVHFVYEDGSEAKPSYTLYLTEGQPYDVDSYVIEGYHTYELEYKGNMPAYNLEYRVIYISNKPYLTMTEIANSQTIAQDGDKIGISNEEELIFFEEYVNAGKNTEGVTFIQLDDIELSENTAYTSAGSEDKPFNGVYDGQYFGISGLPCSLFGYLNKATVQAVGLEYSETAEDDSMIGAVAAEAIDSNIFSCSITIAVTGNAVYAGGIVGYGKNTSISQCSVSGNISARIAGGIAGALSASTVWNCSITANVDGTEVVGGFVGVVGDPIEIINSYTTGNIQGETAGGMIGKGENIKLSNVYQSGTVTGGDPIIGSGSGDLDSVWYDDSAVSAFEDAIGYSRDEDGVAKLLTLLNEWVEKTGSNEYLTWSESVGEEGEINTPVFGLTYKNWIMNFVAENGKISYVLDTSDYPDGTVYIALYDAQGQMISIMLVAESGSDIAISENAAYAQAFIISEDGSPLSTSVTLQMN